MPENATDLKATRRGCIGRPGYPGGSLAQTSLVASVPVSGGTLAVDPTR